MQQESEAELDKLESMRERLRRHLDGFKAGTVEIIKLQPGMTEEDLSETVQDQIAEITTILNRNGRA
jgi:hypothetical protein